MSTPDHATDPRLAPFRNLRDRGLRAEGRFIVEGVLAVERLLASEFEIESIVCTPSQRARLELDPNESRCPVVELPRKQIAALAGFDFHRGVLACARRPPDRVELEPWEIEALRQRDHLTIVAAEALADPRNLGALIRNAAAFEVDLVLVDARGADLLSRLAIRTSVGNVFRMPTLVTPELPATVAQLRRELSAKVLAATPSQDATNLRDFTVPPKRLVLVGNEGEGLSPNLLALADHQIRIPVAPESDSLNVAAATAIVLYELTSSC